VKKVRSFDPISAESSRVLILGSMPGERSLAAGQYYAHPRNAFWKIMQRIVGWDEGAEYDQRILALKAHGIALWDVLHSCHREGSLDTAIRAGSVKVNDFRTFFRQHSKIDTVLLNGSASAQYYERYVLPELQRTDIRHLRMPSTSPAHAAMSFEQKAAVWWEAIDLNRKTPAPSLSPE
jgi:hypoxanthine-DNA glycosylase